MRTQFRISTPEIRGTCLLGSRSEGFHFSSFRYIRYYAVCVYKKLPIQSCLFLILTPQFGVSISKHSIVPPLARNEWCVCPWTILPLSNHPSSNMHSCGCSKKNHVMLIYMQVHLLGSAVYPEGPKVLYGITYVPTS